MTSSTMFGLAGAGLAAVLVAGFAPSSDAAVTTDVTGTESHRVQLNSTYVQLTSDRTPAGSNEGAPIQWKILVGPAGHTLHTRLTDTQGAGEVLAWNYTFPTTLGSREIQIYKNDALVADYTFTP